MRAARETERPPKERRRAPGQGDRAFENVSSGKDYGVTPPEKQTEGYQPSPIKRHWSTKAEVEQRRNHLLGIVYTQQPMTVRQVFYQATVRDLVEKSEAGYNKIEETLREMAPDADITFESLAVSPEQIDGWNLPTRPTKVSDTRSKGFGEISVELDAIEPAKLRRIVESALEEHLPQHQFEVLKAAEESERTILRQLVAGLGSAAA